MEIILAVIFVALVAALFLSKNPNAVDVNKDGKVDVKDALATADINKDGKVDVKDAVAAAEVVVEEVKKTATKAKTAVKKTATAAKKTAAKKVKA